MSSKELTSLLRTGNDPLWIRLREIIERRELDVETLALAVSHEDDQNYEYGVLVSKSGQVFEFGLSYQDRQIEEAEVVEWNDRTNDWKDWYHSNDVKSALDHLSYEST